MGIIINPRGIGGSGKTELARRIMREYGWPADNRERHSSTAQPIYSNGREYPLGYRFRHPRGHRPLAVFGHYERTSGGCDTIRLRDGGLAAVFRMAAEYAAAAHDVLIEGLHLSSETDASAALARAYPLHVIHLGVAPEAGARNLVRRRRASRQAMPLILRAAIAERDRVEEACERLRRHAHIHSLGFDESLAKARELLRLI